jgi:hypothetical protein
MQANGMMYDEERSGTRGTESDAQKAAALGLDPSSGSRNANHKTSCRFSPFLDQVLDFLDREYKKPSGTR